MERKSRSLGYHCQNYRESSPKVNQFGKQKSGIDRRGVFPTPYGTLRETPRRRAERIFGKPLPEITGKPEQKSPFAEYDLGNKELPIHQYKAAILAMVAQNKVSQLNGETGSGKTTQLCQYALEAGYDRIVYLMPRRTIVDNVTDRVTHELHEQLTDVMPDDLVGKVHGKSVTATDDSKIQFMTAASFSNKLPELREKWGNDDVLIVSDEIHEANLDMEIATAQAAKTVDDSDTWHLVLSTATPDPVTAEAYEHINGGGEMPSVLVPTRPHEIESIEENACVDEAYKAYSESSRKAMVFVEGISAIDDTIKELKRHKGKNERVRFLKLHGNMSDTAREEALNELPQDGERWVIVSTPAGQSGITARGVDLVISNGLTRSPELDEEGAEGLPIRFCTQAELRQQAGRAGRDVEGGRFILAKPIHANQDRNKDNEFYHFVSFDEREKTLPPEIYHKNLSSTVLEVTATGDDFAVLNRAEKGYLAHKVGSRPVEEAYDSLETLGAIVVDDNNVARMTPIGREMHAYPLRPELARSACEATSGGYPLNIQAAFFAVAAAVEAGSIADKRKSDWREAISEQTRDDYLAEYDMFLKSRPYYYGKTVNERKLNQLGFIPSHVQTTHHGFAKICKRRGLKPYDIHMDPLTPDDQEKVKDILLVGMPDLIYHYERTVHRNGKDEPVYKNMARGEGAVERKLSDRGIASRRLGKQACKIVAGEGWWYQDTRGEIHSLIERAMPVEKEQVERAMAKVAVMEYAGLMVNEKGVLVKTYQNRAGSYVEPSGYTKGVPAQTPKEVELLVAATLRSGLQGVKDLVSSDVPDDQKSAILREAARGATTVYDVEGNIWGLQQEQLAATAQG